MTALVQSDAAGELPPGVQAAVRPTAAGVRRAVAGLVPVRHTGLFHGLDVDLPLGHRSGPLVATVHDTSVFDTPWAYSRVRARGEQLLLRTSLGRADLVLAVSAFTAGRVRALLGVSCVVTPLAPGPGFTVPAGAQVDAVAARHGLTAPYVLHVGTIEPRKDVPLLAAACREVDVPLVLAGAVLPGQQVPVGARHLGYVPAADLPALYAHASVVAYPSRYEGFGLPPVEAMACGAAVVASQVGALPETLGAAAVLVPPQDLAALSAALGSVLADPDRRQALRAAAVVQAATLSWERTAALTLAGYRTVGWAG